MLNYIKFLNRLPVALRLRLLRTIERITKNDLTGLDIKQLAGMDNIFRCRVGKIRIIFEKGDEDNIIHDIGFRGGIY